MPVGSYTVTVTDANNAVVTRTFTITQPSALTVTAASQTNVSCFGGSNGTASINAPTGGAGGYTYDWTPGNPTGDGTLSVSGLSGGVTYTVTVTDANGCTATRNFPITQPTAISLASGSQTNVTVSGGSDGTATVSPTGGAGGYTYNWTPGNPAGDGTNSVTGLSATTYTVTVTDANGCPATRSFTITEPAATTVSSVTRLTPSPTATAQVSYRVVFAASVTGVSPTNFAVTPLTGSITGASVSNVSGSGTTYTVVVNTGSGSGTLRLDVANSTGISPAASNVPYTSGQPYTITKSFAAAPQLTIQGTGGTGSDVSAFVDTVRVFSGSSAFANALRNGSFEYHGPLSNGDFGYNPPGASWTFNSQAAIAEQGSAFTPTTPIPNGIAVAVLQSNGGGNGQIQQNLAVPTGTSYQVRFQAAQRVCCTTLDQSLNVFLNGVFLGTILPNSSSYSTFTSATFAVTAPALTATVSTTASNPTSTSPIPFSVSFSQPVGTSFVATDVTVTGGTLTSGSFAGSGSGPYTFTVTPSGTGPVTASLAAGVANDANNTQNTASNTVSVQYTQPVTAAPVVIAPAHVSLINDNTPTYTGTAPAGSTVTVYVDGSSIGTTTATGGNFSLTQPTALADGTHTVNATAQSPGSAVSVTSNTNGFTVDATRPTVSISSTTAANGGTTSTLPIAYTVTFSEAVTGFVSGDVTVGNGSKSGFSGSGTTYTFNVTPTANGAVTVDVPANVAQDAANNFNTAATQYSITYQAGTAAPTLSVSGNTVNGEPTFTGTAPAGSTVTITVKQGTTTVRTLTATATGGGTFSYTVPQASGLPIGSYTAAATAQISGNAVSGASNTVSFTVPTTGPATTLSSTAPNPATLSPIPVTATFSRTVFNFAATDVSVSNGAVSNFVQVDGKTYTFDVIPAANGTVTVNVAAGVTQDSLSRNNLAAAQLSRNFQQQVTAAPVITAPTNNTFTNGTVTISGTAPANSEVVLYLSQNGGAPSPATVTATAGGTFSVGPLPFPAATYAVYATAQGQGEAVSAHSATITFTVDQTAPTVAITSTATSPTSTSPIPVTVTFSESVTGFTINDVVVTGGSKAGFSGSGTTYTFNVTPSGNGTITANVAANVAQDAATNGNTAAPQFSITYAAVATITSWLGGTSTDWFDASNWSDGVPTTGLNVAVSGLAPRMPFIGAGTGVVKNITLGTGATLTMTGGTLDVRGDFTNNGTFVPTGGTVVLGTTVQTNGPNTLGSARIRFWNLTVNANGVNVSTSAGASARRLVQLNGSLVTNGNPFTLESDATGTALVVNNGGVLFGTVTAQRYINTDAFTPAGYRHLSSPLGLSPVSALATTGFAPVVNDTYNTSALPLNVTPFPTIFGYDQARLATATNNLDNFSKGWVSPTSSGDDLAVGQGYTVNVAAGRAVNFVGPQNNGTITLPLARNSGATAADAGWQLLGNPYPSPLNLSLVAPADRTNLDAAIYVFSSTSQYAGAYRSYVNGVGDPVLPMGQGFFARVSAGQTSGSMTFRNAQRLTNYTNPTYHRSAGTRPLVQLDLRGAGLADPLYVYFEQGATAGADGEYDAVKLPNTTGLNLSAQTAGQELAIQGLPLLGTTQVVVPLMVRVPATGTYTLHAAQLLNLGTTRAYLRDRQTGALVDLNTQPSYVFTLNAAYTGVRFELVFAPQSALATAPASLSAQVAVFPNPARRTAFVELPAGLSRTAATAALVDALGRTVRTYALPAGLSTHALPLADVAAGVYSLRVATAQGTVTKKLVVE